MFSTTCIYKSHILVDLT